MRSDDKESKKRLPVHTIGITRYSLKSYLHFKNMFSRDIEVQAQSSLNVEGTWSFFDPVLDTYLKLCV